MFLTRGKKFSASLQKLFLPVSEAFSFHFSRRPVTQYLLSKLHFCVLLKAGWLYCPKLTLLEKSTGHKNFCCWSYFGLKDLHEFIFAGGTIGSKFVSKFKMSLWEKMLLSIKIAHFNFTLIRLNNKSSPQFIPLNGTKCRLSKVIVHLWILEGQGKPFFCRIATRTFLRICRLIIYRNMAMLLKASLS